MIIALEGIQAAGKSTTTEFLGKRLRAQVVKETTANHPFLTQVYDDSHRDDATVELGFLVVHANAYRLIDRSQLAICDYSPVKDLLFADDMLSGDDLEFFLQVYRYLYRGHQIPDLVLYLDVPPETCMARVAGRRQRDAGRAFEQGLTLQRLARMRRRYQSRLRELGNEVITLPLTGSESREAVADQAANMIESRLAHIVPPRDASS
jgi:thymidylate kinase